MAEYTKNYNLEKQQGNEYISIEGLNGNFDTIDTQMKEMDGRVGVVSSQLGDIPKFQTAGGTGTAVTLTGLDLVDGNSKTFIVSANNNGAATTVNGKPLYKPNTTTAPTLTAGKAVTIWYNLAGDRFFIKASAEGDAVAANVLAGKKFSNDDDTGLTGSMVNRGAVTLTPSTTNQSIAQGYHDGTGYVAGDTDLVSANIKAGVNIFGVAGNSNVVDTSAGDAVASQLLNGKKAYVDGALVTGSMVDRRGSVQIAQATSPDTQKILVQPPSGFYDGATWVSTVDTDFIASNIRKDVNLFGLIGSVVEGKPMYCGLVNIDKSAQIYTYYASGFASNAYRISVGGLNFLPKFILACAYDEYAGFTATPCIQYASTEYNIATYSNVMWSAHGQLLMSYLLTNNGGFYYLNSSGFCLPVPPLIASQVIVMCIG